MNTLDRTTDPDVVFHYASVAALWSIIQNKSIWATNIRYLNDISESTHCITALRRRVSNYLARKPSESADALQNALNEVDSDLEPPYVASFSKAPDSLPLWRSYCPNGNGVSIGFKVSALMRSVLTHTPPNEDVPSYSVVRPVEYLDLNDFELQDSILDGCLANLAAYHMSKATTPPGGFVGYTDDYFLMYGIASQACLVKHAGFKTEEEIRLIAPPLFLSGTPLKFRFSRTTVIPYVEVLMPGEMETLPAHPNDSYFIDHVVVGPTPNPDLTVEALKLMFEAKGGYLSTIPIFQSEIPYRDL